MKKKNKQEEEKEDDKEEEKDDDENEKNHVAGEGVSFGIANTIILILAILSGLEGKIRKD